MEWKTVALLCLLSMLLAFFLKWIAFFVVDFLGKLLITKFSFGFHVSIGDKKEDDDDTKQLKS